MELKSLKLALNVLDVCLIRHKRNVCYYGNDKEYKKAKEAKGDIENCIKVVEKQIEELKDADIVDALGTCLCFPITVDLLDRGYIKNNDPLNPFLRAEKIAKELNK